MIENILKRRQESDSYLTHVSRHRWSRKSQVKIDEIGGFNTKKYHVFAPMGRFQLELIYLYFPPS